MSETPITSRDNPIFKRLKKLAESARARREGPLWRRPALSGAQHTATTFSPRSSSFSRTALPKASWP
jgi:hypothetical protein